MVAINREWGWEDFREKKKKENEAFNDGKRNLRPGTCKSRADSSAPTFWEKGHGSAKAQQQGRGYKSP